MIRVEHFSLTENKPRLDLKDENRTKNPFFISDESLEESGINFCDVVGGKNVFGFHADYEKAPLSRIS